MAGDAGMTMDDRSGLGALGRLIGRLAAALFLTVGLSACAIPPAISIASMAADGVLLVATGKSKADHGLSLATGKDCSTLRALDGENVCQDIVIAQAEPLPADVGRELDAFRAASRDLDQARAASRDLDQTRAASPGSGRQALAAAFRAPSVPPVMLVAVAPAPAAAVPQASTPQTPVRLAALRPPPTGATPGRIKLDRPASTHAVAATAASLRSPPVAASRLGAAKATDDRLAMVKKAKRLAAAKAKRLAAQKAKTRMAAPARKPLLPPVAVAPAPHSVPAKISHVGAMMSGMQLALAVP